MAASDLDAYLDQVLIGGREKRPVVIADNDREWARRFEIERQRVRAALGHVAIRIEHIGSTSVEGLAAKPIIDVLVTVKEPDDEAVIVPALERTGYELRVREPGHRMFRTSERDVHVHVWGDTDPEVARYLRFRDRLRASTEDRAAYERLKRDLAQRAWSDLNHYAEAKTELIETIISQAGRHPGSPGSTEALDVRPPRET